MEFKGKKVLVFGTGRSGIGAGRLLINKGAEVILYDGNPELDAQEIKQRLYNGEQAETTNVDIILGELEEEKIKLLDLVILSPGVPTDLPVVDQMRSGNIPVWGEIELAYVCGHGDVLGITGTNGKTTTTALLGEIMRAYRDEVYVVGNIGNPYTEIALETTSDSVVVAELSSFQLETVHTLCPKVSAMLNISPDHLDRHHTMEAYIKAKEQIAVNQTAQEICVLNYEDKVTKKFGEKTKASVLYFSSARKLNKGIYLDNGNIIFKDNEELRICHIDELKLLGTHNYENIMAAAVMALAYGVPAEVIRKAVLAFNGVAHRIEYVREHQGVKYYNDSKGTNPDAAMKGIQAMERPTYLIGGGYDKQASYAEWIDSFDGKVKKLVLLGATKEAIAEEARKKGFENIIMTETLEEAVALCAEMAERGEAVLLSPACASWGMFPNYEVRGDKFKELVNSL